MEGYNIGFLFTHNMQLSIEIKQDKLISCCNKASASKSGVNNKNEVISIIYCLNLESKVNKRT